MPVVVFVNIPADIARERWIKNRQMNERFDLPEDVFVNLMKVTKKVSKIIDKNLDVKRTAMVMEGMGVNHVHIKLYPMHGLKEKFEEIWTDKEKTFFNKYPGYITTILGPEADKDKLKKIAEKIRE